MKLYTIEYYAWGENKECIVAHPTPPTIAEAYDYLNRSGYIEDDAFEDCVGEIYESYIETLDGKKHQ